MVYIANSNSGFAILTFIDTSKAWIMFSIHVESNKSDGKHGVEKKKQAKNIRNNVKSEINRAVKIKSNN